MAARIRPRIKVVPTPTDIVVEVTSAVGLVLIVAMAVYYYPMLPEKIPTHFDAKGAVDGWGPKSALFPLPIVALGVYVLLSVVSRFPHTFNYPIAITDENAERQYRIAVTTMRWLKMEIVWMFAYLNKQTIQVSLGKAKGLDPASTFVFLGAICATVVVLVVRAYRAR